MKVVAKREKSSLSFAINALIGLLFIFYILDALYISKAITWGIYVLLGINALIGIYLSEVNSKFFWGFLVAMIVSGLVNFLAVGNTNLYRIYFTFCACFIAVTIIKRCEKTLFLYLTLVNAAIITYSFITRGNTARVFLKASNNFVSVYLLIPAVMYYLFAARQKDKTSLFPAVIVWILSLYALGRGGIIASTALLLSIILFGNRDETSENKKKRRIKVLLIVLIVIVAVTSLFFTRWVSFLGNFELLQRFSNYELNDTGRFVLWEDYKNHCITKKSNILWGVRIQELIAYYKFNGNLHNSYIQLHAYYGIIGFALIAYALIKNVRDALSTKDWMYVCLLGVYFIRGFTDRVCSGGIGMIVFIVLLLYPSISRTDSRLVRIRLK